METATRPETAYARPPPAPLTHLLASYTTHNPLRSPSPLPASSRVDPSRAQRAAPPYSSPLFWTIPTWIAFIRFALAKGLHIIWSLISHFVFGPKRPSWGYRMTFITSFMRNVADHSSLADVVLIRRLFSLQTMLPVPSDAVVTPITFIVPLRQGGEAARGFLKEWDELETGTRELTGEWVVGVDVWKRLKAERRARLQAERKRYTASPLSEMNTTASTSAAQIPGTAAYFANRPGQRQRTTSAGSGSGMGTGSHSRSGRYTPSNDSDTESSMTARKGFAGERVIYYIHGGAYYVGNAATHRLITIGISKACNARVFAWLTAAITYRLAPEHPFPLPLHDVLHGYLRLLTPPLSIPPENIIVMGDSAGGGLSLALCLYLRDEGYTLPAGLVLMSPWVDLTMSCGSHDENAHLDVIPMPGSDDHLSPVACYLGPGVSTYLTHPYASPLFADLSGLPPMLIQAGDSEILRDEITLLAHKATLSGVQVTHELYEDMVHIFQMFTFLKAAQAAVASAGRWVQQTLPRIEAERAAEQEREAMLRADREAQAEQVADRVTQEMATDPRLVRTGHMSDGDNDPYATTSSRAALPRASSNLHGLRLELGAPDIDHDSLPDEDSEGSGSITPTASGARSPLSAAAMSARSARSSISLSSARSPSISVQRISEEDYFSQSREDLPRLRRSVTGASSGRAPSRPGHNRSTTSLREQAQQAQPSPSIASSSPTTTSTSTSYLRRRRPTASSHPYTHPDHSWMIGATSPSASSRPSPRAGHVPLTPSGSGFASLLGINLSSASISSSAMSPGQSGSGSGVGNSSAADPASPAMSASGRRRLRSPTITAVSPHPSTRARSKSHSNIHDLVHGYVEGGAANETTVYAPGGEIKSVGVLGEDE